MNIQWNGMRRVKILVTALLTLALIAITARIYAPVYITKVINNHIANSSKIGGAIEGVDLHLWRGAYSIEGIALYTVEREDARPLLTMPRLELTLEWRSLIRGQLLSELVFHSPVLNLHDGKGRNLADENALDENTTWLALADRIAPFAINRLDIRNGELHLYVNEGEWQRGLTLTKLNGQLLNITNSLQVANTLDGQFNLEGELYNVSHFTLKGTYSPYEPRPTFDVDFTMAALPAKQLDALVQYYTPYDIEAGTLDIAAEMQANQGAVDGYLRLGLKEISVFDWRADIERDGDHFFSALFEGLSDGLAQLLENNQTGAIATKVPLAGELDNIDTPLLTLIWGIIENAFIRAYEIELEGSLTFKG
ncbi:DUF748 domain-containing protein [Simiduia sp. 21SJ11W-1]|uniref:DUF748 domain-containing protein n=1 Tax=Simiduia sp. 21SJ11W-1 TaxID=2909669 RepID=UPI00209CF84E|nr:DUF748 domain-containing protein [Simiduia sp. 21SJ11W-1]UTA48508.1 DUF748 domain-containing protein [Simiduia sp. 21SJ11W-1]